MVTTRVPFPFVMAALFPLTTYCRTLLLFIATVGAHSRLLGSLVKMLTDVLGYWSTYLPTLTSST